MGTLEIVVGLAQMAAAAAVLVAVFAYLLSKKQLNFDVITSCTTRWQQIMPQLVEGKGIRRIEAEERYVDLCNEELFYFREGYLPKVVVREWLSGMVYYLPHYHGEVQDEELKGVFGEMVDSRRLDPYPRVKEIFTVAQPRNPHVEGEREALVDDIMGNIKRSTR